MKEFKVGKYHIFDRDIKKIGKATIHGFVEVNGTKHAVVSYRDNDNIPYIKDLPMCELDGRTAIFLLDAVFIFADAPVQPKVVKFKVGKIYSDYEHNVFSVVDKYTPYKGETHLVLDDRFIAKVEVKDNVEYASFVYSDGSLINLAANKYLEI